MLYSKALSLDIFCVDGANAALPDESFCFKTDVHDPRAKCSSLV
jgi:hypothetical protein